MSTSVVADVWGEVAKVISDAWDGDGTTSSLTLLWDGVDGDAPTDGSAFGRAQIRFDTGEKTTVGSGGRYRRDGTVIVQCFGRWGDGGKEARQMGEVLMAALDTGNTSSGVWFRDVSPRDIGRDEAGGPYFQTNVRAAFTYQQVR